MTLATRLQGRLRDIDSEIAAIQARAAEAISRLRAERAKLEALSSKIPAGIDTLLDSAGLKVVPKA